MSFKDFSLKSKALVALVPIALSTCVLSFIIYQNGNKKNDNVENAILAQKLVAEQKVAMISMSEALRGVLINPSDQSEFKRKKENDEIYAQKAEELSKLLHEVKEIDVLNDEMAKIDEEELDVAENKVMELAERSVGEASRFYNETYLPIRLKQNKNFKKLFELVNEHSVQVIKAEEEHKKLVAFETILFAFASLIIGGICIYWIVNRFIIRPVNAVSEAISGLQDGKLEMPSLEKGQDEIGKMASSLDQTLRNLQSIFETAKVNWSEVKDQKRREQEAMAKAQEEKDNAERALVAAQAAKIQSEAAKAQAEQALNLAEVEKKEALKAKYVADEEKARAQKAMEQAREAMMMAEKEKARTQELAEKEKLQAMELQSKVDQILRVVRAAEGGDLTQNLSVQGTDAIGQLAEGLRSLFGQFSNDIVQIGHMARLLSKQAELLTSASQDMSSNSSITLTNAGKMEVQSGTVLDGMKNLNNATMEMKQGINEVAKQSTESSKYVSNAVKLVSDVKDLGSRLEESSEDISRFIAVINSIARQTNLLALNATIEAARAGEMGKGFAVVANEVKELARQSGEAADEITEKVGTIKINTTDIMQSIQSVIALIDNLNNSSKIVAAAAEEQYATSEQFAHLINQSVQEVEGISSGTKEVQVSAKSTNDVVKTTAQLSRELSDAAEKLSGVVKKFRLKESFNERNVRLVS